MKIIRRRLQRSSWSTRALAPHASVAAGVATLLLTVLGLVIAAASPSTLAHAPELHGFKLVTFAKPAPAPDFELEALGGGTRSLADFRGRYVLLNFWATWCPPCLEEMPSMDGLEKRYEDRNFAVVAVSTDKEGADIVQGFVDRLGVGFVVLLDPEQRVAGEYGAVNLPVSFLLDREGRVIAAALGARDWLSEESLSYLDENLVVP
ncbi:MAG: TlpA disulfide reductase family protein [Gammaproteobacteria bacterium]